MRSPSISPDWPAPAAVTALLVGIKLGAYGLIRFAVPLAPQAALAPYIVRGADNDGTNEKHDLDGVHGSSPRI